MDEVLEGEVTCANHNWVMQLDPISPNYVAVVCARCLASLNAEWPGATDMIHIELPAFTVVGGWHTSTAPVQMLVDVFIRQSQAYSLQQHSFQTTTSVTVTPRESRELEG